MNITPRSASEIELLIEGIDALDSGISVFDNALCLVAGNRRFLELLDFPEHFGRRGTPLETFFRFNAQRGEYGAGDLDAQVAERLARARRAQPHVFDRTRPDGTVIEIRGTPLRDGGFVTIYTDVTAQRQREQALREMSARLEQRVEERTAALREREAELARKTAQLERVIDHVRHGITLLGPNLELELCNAQFLEIMRFPAEFGRPGTPFEAFIRHNAERGEYGPGAVEAQVAERLEKARHPQPHHFERTRPDGTSIEVIGTPTPDGGFVTTFIDITERKHAEARLRQSEARFRDFARASSDWLFETDAELRLIYLSERFYRMSGFAPEQVLGKRRTELAAPEALTADPERWAAHQDDLARRRPFRDFEYPIQCADGSRRDVRISATPCFDDDGAFTGYRGCGSDITPVKAAERALRASEAQLRAMLEASPVGVALVARADQRIRFCNSRLAELVGQPPEALRDQPPCASCREVLLALAPGEAVSDWEVPLTREDGTPWWGLVSARPVTYQGEDATLLWIYDVTELHSARDQLHQLAHHDPLTGIPNRRYFEEAAQQALARAARHRHAGALIFFDLDGFKAVNDRWGHQKGDALLCAIAERVAARLRRTDFVARLGGDEFALICEPVEQAGDPLAFAREIVRLVTTTAERFLPGCGVSASAGVAFFDAAGPSLDTLMRYADGAMYRAKAGGRATVCQAS